MIPTIDMLKIGLTALKKQRNKEDKWQKTFNEMFDGHFVPQYATDLEIAIIKMLEIAYKDRYETISWWVYEQDFGQNCKEKPALWLEDKTPVNLRNIDELYDYLVKEASRGETKTTNNKETPKEETKEMDFTDILANLIKDWADVSQEKVIEEKKKSKKSSDNVYDWILNHPDHITIRYNIYEE
jgi:hypothetical protein